MSTIQKVLHLILTFLEACIHVLSKRKGKQVNSQTSKDENVSTSTKCIDKEDKSDD